MTFVLSTLKFFLWSIVSVFCALTLGALGIHLYFSPGLPNPQELRAVELQTPLRIYSSDGKLISEIGEKRRSPLSYNDIPPLFIDALLASEDDNFFEHNGIDFKGLARASLSLIRTGEKRSGGSTITMQVAKNYYLSTEKTFSRKFTEILLALKIEQELSKEEILELYINKIYLGKRAYGIEAAAQVYYGKSIHDLTLAQLAVIAGLPQAPSAANPINNPKRAFDRRNYVLSRMLYLEKISQEDYREAASQPIDASYHGVPSELSAPYIAEMVRREMFERYGEEAYTAGYKVYTTVHSVNQLAANRSLQKGLINYDHDHGWRAPKTVIPPVLLTKEARSAALQADPENQDTIDWQASFDQWQQHLLTLGSNGLLFPGIIFRLEENGAWAFDGQKKYWIDFQTMLWAKPYVNQNIVGKEPTAPQDFLQLGMEVWLEKLDDEQAALSQFPDVEGALVSLRPEDGAVLALVGGFSNHSNQYNRAIQADRQPGSAFKPFIYSAALEKGFTPASIINDAPVVFEDASLESTWRPQNNSGKFYGPTRLREALYRSQNLVSIRILNQVGPHTAINYITPFGFPKEKLNADLSLALGASGVTPMELSTGFAALANGGFAVKPYVISHIEDENNTLLFRADPQRVCHGCLEEPSTPAPRIMDERAHYLMISMLKDVVRKGTGQRALALNRNDLAGKTGTTNDQKDGWFAGFNPDVATIVWVGFDQNRTLGRWAFGANTALPIWVDYMQEALAEVPEHPFEEPAGIVSVRIDPVTGLLAAPGQRDAIFEFFREENVPKESVRPLTNPSNEEHAEETSVPEQLF